jgi:hypothetical protein
VFRKILYSCNYQLQNFNRAVIEGIVASRLKYNLKIEINVSNILRHNVKNKTLQKLPIPAHAVISMYIV